MSKYLVFDTVSGAMLDSCDTYECKDGWMLLHKGEKTNLYSSYPVIRVQEVDKEEYEELVRRSQEVDEDDDVEYDGDYEYEADEMRKRLLNITNGR